MVEVELSPEPTLGPARGRRDEVTPAQVELRGEGEREELVNWSELNLREAQITALERELANLKALSRASHASTSQRRMTPDPNPSMRDQRCSTESTPRPTTSSTGC